MALNRRRQWLINPKFQLSFLAFSAGSAAATALIFYSATVYFFWKLDRLGETLGLPENHVFFKFVSEQRWTMSWVLLGFSLVAVGFLIGAGLVMSHRVAGPLYRMRLHLDQVAQGSDKPLKFREKDYFQEIPEAYNRRFSRGKKKKAA
jgi:sensor histidine kinase YesM